ncbi:class III chitinase [Phlyctema vagabunda]|uniref:chitinase n=1 Tax=Phlyctema vagabunda TaxID=108571 RepID=A0ABR4PX21_9HELO
MPCQKGFGRCEIVAPPKCGGSTASKGRKIAYYQAGNVERSCQAISPSQINTTGLTHLILAFASIDPKSFIVTARNTADIDLYPKFTKLKTKKLQTWIAIGGGSFSSRESKTYTTWSDMVSSANNRATFVKSLVAFLRLWGFQGVDLDWEFPGIDTGGQTTDLVNFVALAKEIRSAFGKKYGLSVSLPPDFASLRKFEPKALEPYVDFFGLMAYDLHGPWDASNLGKFIRPQTALPEIETSALPLWYDAVSPSKINLGLAYYGRGYTVSSTSCMGIDCAYTQPSIQGPCTRSPGLLSLREIEGLIARRKLVPKLLAEQGIKQLTWDNQWMGYDDFETMALKMKWADSRCLGGTSVWSIDMHSGAGSIPFGDNSGDPNPKSWDTPVVSTAPLVKSPDATCGTGTNYTCLSSTFGNCCSLHGYCGSAAAYCGTGCQAGFGKCS